MPADYSGQNLRGRSFKGQDLSGANFSGADIRGANFTGANLRGTNFISSKAGLQLHQAVRLIIVFCLLSGISGIFLGFSSVWLLSPFRTYSIEDFIVYAIILMILGFFLSANVQRNLVPIAFNLAVAVVLSGLVAVVVAFTAIFTRNLLGTGAGAGTGAITVIITGTVTITVSVAAAFFVGGAKAGFLTGTLAVFLAGVVATASCVFIARLTVRITAVGIISSVAVTLVGIYAGWRALKGNKSDEWIRSIAIAFSATGGTSFRNSNLTDVNFTGATLKNTDFRNAILTRTCFRKTKKLDLIRPGISYLQNTQVRQLLVRGQGQDTNFDGDKLRGVNFQGANLADASFIGADLSEANLQDADLSRAILKQTQLDATDFTGATLTGAYIEDWNITHETNFRGVKCEYVYMRLPTKENPDPLRKPDNNAEVFADGEFGDFIKPIVDTLDLYHNQGVDPRAIAISFKQLAEKNPEAELEIVAMERRGEDKFLLRTQTASEANKSQLSAEYFEIYNHVKALAQQEVKALMAEKDNRIVSLENFVNTALQRPNFYSSTQIQEVSTMTSNPGGFSVGGSVGGDINNVQGDNNRAVQGDNNQAIQGDGNQVNTEAEASLTKDDIVVLLTQLENLVKAAEVSEETKETAIEDINAAKKATQKEEPKKNVALANLESVTQTLEKTSKTVDAGQKLWNKAKPIITKIASWLGAAAGSYLLKL